MSKVELELIRQRIADWLCRIHDDLFTPEMMLTLVVRHPTNREYYFVTSNDGDHVEVAKLLMKEQGGIDAATKGCNR